MDKEIRRGTETLVTAGEIDITTKGDEGGGEHSGKCTRGGERLCTSKEQIRVSSTVVQSRCREDGPVRQMIWSNEWPIINTRCLMGRYC